MINTNYIIKTW